MSVTVEKMKVNNLLKEVITSINLFDITLDDDKPMISEFIRPLSMNVIFACGDVPELYDYDKKSFQPFPYKSFIVGNGNRNEKIRVTKNLKFITVKLKPWIVRLVTKGKASLFFNEIKPLDALGRLWKEMADDVLRTEDVEEKIHIIKQFFIRKNLLGNVNKFYFGEIRHATMLNMKLRFADYKEYKKTLSNVRSFHRHFYDNVGMSPKDFYVLCRRIASLNGIVNKKETFSDLAENLNYSSLAHMSNEIKNFTSFTPSEIHAASDDFAKLTIRVNEDARLDLEDFLD